MFYHLSVAHLIRKFVKVVSQHSGRRRVTCAGARASRSQQFASLEAKVAVVSSQPRPSARTTAGEAKRLHGWDSAMGKDALGSNRSSSATQEAHMSWSDSQTCVDINGIKPEKEKTDRTARSQKPLLRDVPLHRRVAVLWKGINAFVPVFNAKTSWKQRLGLASHQRGHAKQVQVW